MPAGCHPAAPGRTRSALNPPRRRVQFPMNPARIGYVRYLNTWPLVEGLGKLGLLELTAAVPSKIIGMLERDEVDLGLASVVDAARSDLDLVVFPVGMIGCDGPTFTVRLFSRVPAAEVARVHADTDSHTSACLCQVILARTGAGVPALVDFDARERYAVSGGADDGQWPQAMLLIGDKVITDPPPSDLYPFQLDLGQAWKDLTGLPFVYAAWMCRADRAEALWTAADLLDRQRRHNLTRLDWIARQRGPEHRWPVDEARRYLGEFLKFDLGPREREGAERFLAECAALGLVRSRPLTWADAAAAHGE